MIADLLRNQKITCSLLALVVLAISGCGNADSKGNDSDDVITEITWEQLIPADFKQPENPFATMSQDEIDKVMDGSPESQAKIEELQKDFDYAPTVEALDGVRVRLPAYVTPLEFDGDMKLEEFLLVPYQGACIHVPPPPSNQIVHATPTEAVELEDPYRPVWAVGTLKVDTITSDLAEAGYQLELEEIMPYTRPEQ